MGVTSKAHEDLLAGMGSLLTGGRWTPPGAFRAVYASLEAPTALDEAGQQNLRMSVPPWMALPPGHDRH